MQPKPVDPAANFAKAESEIRKAAANGCHVAVLPEYHLTSWVPDHPDFIASCAESEAYLPRYQALARELDISIVPGTICESHPASAHPPPPPQDDKAGTAVGGAKELRNMAHFVAAGTGALAGSYQKKNLWHPERPHLSPGRHEPHAAFTRRCATPTAPPDVDEAGLALNPDSERVFLESSVVCRAFENTAAVVFCNKGGCSQAALPIVGKVRNEDGKDLGPDEDGTIYTEVDLDVLRIAEENYKVREDIKGKGWHYGYELVRD
ncbi:putative carbon-nitrogen hydrolase [Diaporthe ampelina]|uniref:Putative carbon-nitrogen hydrolase n=1 Tax=Diaporthe ampelina TaxID=1214573 RepID=A0A0G2G009_9PEZI|nr:putative carbon-nitrogen hydrolase [Diaporthe ampelina]